MKTELNQYLDRVELARVFACPHPERMRWQPFSIGIECRGCGGCCGTSDRQRFIVQPPVEQGELFAITEGHG
jgi:hypothetical protein